MKWLTAWLVWQLPGGVHDVIWKRTNWLVARCVHNGVFVGYRWDYRPDLKFKVKK